ncbi:hypothetical protein Aperf_G00000115276 [Anoplocephala perfoliata]
MAHLRHIPKPGRETRDHIQTMLIHTAEQISLMNIRQYKILRESGSYGHKNKISYASPASFTCPVAVSDLDGLSPRLSTNYTASLVMTSDVTTTHFQTSSSDVSDIEAVSPLPQRPLITTSTAPTSQSQLFFFGPQAGQNLIHGENNTGFGLESHESSARAFLAHLPASSSFRVPKPHNATASASGAKNEHFNES